MAILASSPAKYIWGTGAVLATLVKLPLLSLYYLPSATRPVQEWTLLQAVMNNLMGSFLYHSALVESKTALSLEAGSLGDRFTVVEPGPASLYQGVLASDPAIKPAAVGGTWYPKKYSPTSPRAASPVVLHFHGGGYAIGTGRPDDSAFAGKQLERIGGHAFLLQYRLASNPGGRFPAALQDAITGYNYLLNVEKIPANQIVISGDSVGAHMVSCLLRYLAEQKTGLPNPRAALLWSPALDFEPSLKRDAIEANDNFATDYINADFIMWGAHRFFNDTAAAAPYMNPLGKPFATPVPMWMQVGGKEYFHKETVQFAKEMKSIAGNDAQLLVQENALHDIFFAGNLMGWQKEAEYAADQAGAWVAGLKA